MRLKVGHEGKSLALRELKTNVNWRKEGERNVRRERKDCTDIVI